MSANPEEQQSDHRKLLALLLLLGSSRQQLLSRGVNFVWDPTLHRYWSLTSQSVVTPAQLREWVDIAIARTENRVMWATQRLISGKISYPEWATMTQELLKKENVGLAQIAIGGEWGYGSAGRLGQRLRFLYQKLTDLGLEYEQGLVSPAQMLARIRMAVQYGRGSFEAMVRGAMTEAGLSEEMRVLGAAAHCADCPPISGYWAPIGSLPGIGDSACLANCACSFEYRL